MTIRILCVGKIKEAFYRDAHSGAYEAHGPLCHDGNNRSCGRKGAGGPESGPKRSRYLQTRAKGCLAKPTSAIIS